MPKGAIRMSWFRRKPKLVPVPETAIQDVEVAFEEAQFENNLRKVHAQYYEFSHDRQQVLLDEAKYDKRMADERAEEHRRMAEDDDILQASLVNAINASKNGTRNGEDPWIRTDGMDKYVRGFRDPGSVWHRTKVPGEDKEVPRCLQWLQTEPTAAPQNYGQRLLAEGELCDLPKGHSGKHGRPGVSYQHPARVEPIIVNVKDNDDGTQTYTHIENGETRVSILRR